MPTATEDQPITETVSTWTQQLSDSELLCRDIGHNWMPHSARFHQRSKSYHQTLQCGRCTTQRNRIIARNGEILASNYIYPDHYLAPKGIGRLDAGFRGELRVLSLNRMITAAAEAADKVTSITAAKKKPK